MLSVYRHLLGLALLHAKRSAATAVFCYVASRWCNLASSKCTAHHSSSRKRLPTGVTAACLCLQIKSFVKDKFGGDDLTFMVRGCCCELLLLLLLEARPAAADALHAAAHQQT